MTNDERMYLQAATDAAELAERIRAILPTMANRAEDDDEQWATCTAVAHVMGELDADGAGAYGWARRALELDGDRMPDTVPTPREILEAIATLGEARADEILAPYFPSDAPMGRLYALVMEAGKR